jgi:hypothetical protein
MKTTGLKARVTGRSDLLEVLKVPSGTLRRKFTPTDFCKSSKDYRWMNFKNRLLSVGITVGRIYSSYAQADTLRLTLLPPEE